MHQPSVIGGSDELEDVDGSVRVGSKGIAYIRIEVRQARAINNEVEVLLQPARRFGAESKPRLSDVSFDDLDLVTQKFEKPIAVPLEQRIEYRRVFHHLLEAAFCRVRLLPADQQANPLHVRQIQQCNSPADFA